MITQLARDRNNKSVILAIGLCPREDKINYRWFTENCKTCGLKFQGTPLFCYRGVALLSTAAAHTEQSIFHCTRHVVGNMMRILNGRSLR